MELYIANRFKVFVLAGLFLFGSLVGQEVNGVSVPDPASLSADWWEYFDVPEEDLESRVQDFLTAVEKVPSELSPENQKVAQGEIDSIQANLSALEQLLAQHELFTPSPPPIADTYSINELLDLNHSLRKAKIDLASQKQERKDFMLLLGSEQDKLDQLIQIYRATEERSEDREVAGLRLISGRISVAITQKKIERSNAIIERSNDFLSHLNDELVEASGRLVSDRAEMLQIAQQVRPANDLWRAAKERLKTKENESIEIRDGEAKVVTEARQQELTQKLLKVRIEEIQANNDVILTQVDYILSRILIEPKTVNHAELDKSITNWETVLAEFENKILLWTDQAQNVVQRSGQLLSIEEFPEIPNPVQYRSLLQRILSTAQSDLVLLQKLKNEVQDTSFVLSVLDYKNSAFIGKGAFWFKEITNYFYRFFSKTWESMTKTLFYIGNRPITMLAVFRFFLILGITFGLSRYVLHWLTDIIRKRRGIQKAMIYRINRLIQYLILFIGLIVALTALGFDFSNLILFASALGVGLGFGLQSIFNNFISGVIILFQSHLKVGDYVELESGIRGEIREINVRSTIIRTNDGIEVLIPNSEMISRRLMNWTLKEPYRRIQVPFSVAYGTDKELISKVVVEVAKNIPLTLIKPGVPEPMVYLSKFGDNALEFELVVWVDKKATRRSKLTQSTYLWEIETAFREHEIRIPFPQRDLHVKDAFGNQDLSQLLNPKKRKIEPKK